MTEGELLRLIDEAAADGRTTLDLSGQDLDELPPEIGKLTKLKTLVLGRWDKKKSKRLGNNLKTLPDEIGQLTELRSLLLAYNRFEELPEVIGRLEKLRSLDLSTNQLSSLPEVIV
ncbi:MAG: leucine-rich repeat domain-containing protein, partial [Pseudomonadota bacterium]